MSKIREGDLKRVSLLITLIASVTIASTALAQFPLPAPSTGTTPTACPGCGEPPPEAMGKPVYPYSDPIVAFTGRFLDSYRTKDFQQPFRSARAWNVLIAPEKNRVYMRMGSALVAYNLDTFFTRLASSEPLVQSSVQFPSATRGGDHMEHWLRWHRFFYPENTNIGWSTPIVDGQDRLYGFDWDDRGYVYVAYSLFGWGIVQDDGGTDLGKIMPSMKQFQEDRFTPVDVVSFKTTNGKYWVLAGPAQKKMRLFEATDPRNPVRQFGAEVDLMDGFSKSSDHLRVAGVDSNGRLKIYATDQIVTGGAPLLELNIPGGSYRWVTTDGTNFYGLARLANGNMGVNILTKNSSGGYTPTIVDTGKTGDPFTMRFGGGHLVMNGAVNGVADDLLMYKVTGTQLEQVNLNFYFYRYYSRNDPAYLRPERAGLYNAIPYRQGSKLYLIISAFILGDVYEIRSGDMITANVVGTGAQTGNAPARSTGTIFYGDNVTFLANTSGATPKGVTWEFGNPESGTKNTELLGETGRTTTHRYSGMTTALLGAAGVSRTVKALATGSEATLTLTIKPPVPRFKVAGTNFLFVQGDASSPAPIVVGDTLVDASDGDADGHYADWTPLAGPTPSTVPVSVGDCGVRTVNFAAHYGELNGQLLLPIPDYAAAFVLPFNFSVRPFAAAINAPVAAGGNVTFSSASRFSALASALPADATINWRWELVNQLGQVVNAHAASTGTGRTIQPYVVPSSVFSTTPNLSAQLTITSSPITGSCANNTTSTAKTAPLTGPDPVITESCPSGGPTCTFTVSSASGASMAGWTINWSSLSGNPSSGTGTTHNVAFGSVGPHTVSATASNSVGTSPVVSKTVQITTASNCSTMTANSVFITWQGATSGCQPGGAQCVAGETVTLDVAGWGYDFDCGPHTYAWTGGGTTRQVARTFSVGTQPVSVTIHNGAHQFTATGSIPVGTGVIQQPPNPPTGCPAMTTSNLWISYGSSGTCNQSSSTPCPANQNVPFTVSQWGYDFNCAAHTFQWSFGGVGASGRDANYAFNGSLGSVPVSVIVSRLGQSITLSTNVPVTTGTPGPGPGPGPVPIGNCPSMSSATSMVFISFNNASNTCNASNPTCALNESLSFSALGYNYDFACGTHSFTWDFDGVEKTGKDVTHTFTTPGPHTVKLKVNNGSVTADMSMNVQIGSNPNPVTPQVEIDFGKEPLPGVANAYTFTPFVTPTTNNGIAYYVWDFGNNVTQTVPAPGMTVYVYPTAGNFTVTLKAYGANNVMIGAPHSKKLNEGSSRRRSVGRR